MKHTLEQAILRKDIPEIELYLTEYEAQNPTDFDLYSYRVSLHLLKDDFQTAYRIAKSAVDLNPFDIEANYNLMVCAKLTEQYPSAYQSFLIIQLLQTRYQIELIANEILTSWQQEFEDSADADPQLKQTFANIERDHRCAMADPFKNYQESLCGKILQLHNGDFCYIGLADNWYESYFNFSFVTDPIHAKCELFHIADIDTRYDICAENGKVLVPLCLNYDVAQEETNYVVDACKDPKVFYPEFGRQKYSYLPIEGKAALRTGYPAVFGTPIPLEQTDGQDRKKLVLSIFIDSFNWYLVKELGLETLMPETFRYFSRGVICNQYYSGSEWTLPSIATYWTGKHSGHHMNLVEDYRFDFMKNSKVLAEYFHDAGYVTAKIGGNDAVTAWQGYMRGIDRFVYQHSSEVYRVKEVVSDVIQHIETFKDTCQYIWFDLADLHDVAGGFMRSIAVQSKVPLEKRFIDNDIQTTVRQTYSPNRREIFIQQLRELDFHLGSLYRYIERNYKAQDVVVSLFSDHGTAFMVEDSEPFLSYQRVNVPFMIRGGNLSPQTCNEVIEATDYTAILCKLAGIPYVFDGTDANLPVAFGGTNKRDLAFSQSIFIGAPYRGALHGNNIHYYLETEEPVTPCLRINLNGRKSFLVDDAGNPIRNQSLLEECESIVKDKISHLLIYPDA